MMQLMFQFVKHSYKCYVHVVDVGTAIPIKQHPYRANPLKLKIIAEEVTYMLENDLIKTSSSEWSSPYVLVPEPDGTYQLCTDFR